MHSKPNTRVGSLNHSDASNELMFKAAHLLAIFKWRWQCLPDHSADAPCEQILKAPQPISDHYHENGSGELGNTLETPTGSVAVVIFRCQFPASPLLFWRLENVSDKMSRVTSIDPSLFKGVSFPLLLSYLPFMTSQG